MNDVTLSETSGEPGGVMTPAKVTDDAHDPSRGQQSARARGRANSAKGKRSERDLVAWLRPNGYPGAERTVRTGYRSPARQRRDTGDIDGTPGLVWQVKDVAERAWSQIPGWMIETEHQRAAARADIGILVVKRHGHADAGEWWAWLPLSALVTHTMTTDGIAAYVMPAEASVYDVPVRLALADLVPILRTLGYGTEITT